MISYIYIYTSYVWLLMYPNVDYPKVMDIRLGCNLETAIEPKMI